ncbi:MAG TPA: choice-of-anchor D domain-containing protein [Anaerolineae bacterium]|nr:choice-of-anchor D domain-containing protein [Anaerolineae bacterium]
MKSRAVLTTIVTLILAVASSSCSQPTHTPHPLGSVTRVTDAVEHGNECSALERLFDKVALLYEGACLRVREGGEGLLDFGDSLRLRLFSDTQLGVVRAESAPDVPLDVRMFIEEGGFTSQLTERGGRAVFMTPGNAEITVLGTDFLVVYDPDRQLTTVGSFDGAVEVAGAGVRIALVVGHYVHVPAGQPPGPQWPLTLSRAEFEARARQLQSAVAAARELRSIQLSPVEGGPGTLVTVSGEGWPVGDLVFVGLTDASTGLAAQLDPTTVVVAATVNEARAFNAAFTFPVDARWASLSVVWVTAQSSTGGETVSAMFRMAAPPTPPAPLTPTPTETPASRPTPTPCTTRVDWPIYIIQPGDRLASISRATGATIPQLVLANCLTDDRIYAGQPLRVPRLPATVTPSPTPSATVRPVVNVSPIRLDFDTQRVGETGTSQTVSLTNMGSVAVAIADVLLAGQNPDEFERIADSCANASLAVGNRCAIEIRFAPKLGGTRSAELTILEHATGSPHLVSLSGMAVGVPSARVDPGRLDFGQQRLGASSQPQIVTVTNVGSDVLTISNVSVVNGVTSGTPAPQALQGYPGEFFALDDNCINANLELGKSCSIRVGFTPVIAGSRWGSLVLSSNAADSPQIAPLSGNGVASVPPTVTIINPKEGSINPGAPGSDPNLHLIYWDIVLEGAAVDTQGQALPDSSLRWITDRTDIGGQSEFLGWGNRVTARLYAGDCRDEWVHTITLTATDEYDNVGRAAIEIHLGC